MEFGGEGDRHSNAGWMQHPRLLLCPHWKTSILYLNFTPFASLLIFPFSSFIGKSILNSAFISFILHIHQTSKVHRGRIATRRSHHPVPKHLIGFPFMSVFLNVSPLLQYIQETIGLPIHSCLECWGWRLIFVHPAFPIVVTTEDYSPTLITFPVAESEMWRCEPPPTPPDWSHQVAKR